MPDAGPGMDGAAGWAHCYGGRIGRRTSGARGIHGGGSVMASPRHSESTHGDVWESPTESGGPSPRRRGPRTDRLIPLTLGVLVTVGVVLMLAFRISAALSAPPPGDHDELSGVELRYAQADDARIDARRVWDQVDRYLIRHPGEGLPRIENEDDAYLVIGPGTEVFAEVPATPGVAWGGMTGTSSEDLCVYTASAGGDYARWPWEVDKEFSPCMP